MSESEDWYTKYKTMKRNLEEIRKIRIDGPKQDAEFLNQVIEQHERKHQEHLEEIEKQKEMIDNQIQEIEQKKVDCQKLQKKISDLRFQLGRKNGIIRTLVKYDTLRILMKKPEVFYVEILTETRPSFYLIKEKGELIYSPETGFPVDCPRWMRTKQTVEMSQLDQMCRDFENYFWR